MPIIVVKGLFFFAEEKKDDLIIKVYQHKQNQIVKMKLTNYLKGVVAAEMPANYRLEALKAQSVAARTYTLKKLPQFGGSGCSTKPEADISTNYKYNQAWLSEKEMKNKWGFLPYFYLRLRITKAVEATKGQVLVYNNQLIDAVYHSNSGGQTEASENVWGRKVSYLRSVNSPYDKEDDDTYQHTYEYKLEEFDSKLGVNLEEKINSNSQSKQKLLIGKGNNKLIKVVKYNESGSVNKINIGQKQFEGTEIRDKLSLPSTKFEFSIQADKIVCEVKGNGHGVGMSQAGANGFARHDYNYQQILKHYYSDTEIVNLNQLLPQETN